MNDVLLAWLKELKAGGLTAGTLKVRASHVHRLLKTFDPLTVTGDELVDYVAGQAWKPETRRNFRASMRSFFGYMVDHELRVDDPSRFLRPVKVPPSKPKPTPEAVLAHALALGTDLQVLLLMLGAYQGLRLNEIATLRRSDIEVDSLRICGKGGRTRLLPIHTAVRGPLEVWLAQAPDSEWVFPSPLRAGQHVCSHYVHKKVTANLQGYSTHTLRHRFGTAVYSASGNDIRTTQELLGHSSPATTARYVLVNQDRLNAAVLALA